MSRASLIQAIAAIGADYRPRSLAADHVEMWIGQFPASAQNAILQELAHVLGRTYFSQAYFRDFFAAVITHKSLPDPPAYWSRVSFLRLQQVGNSQNDLLSMFSDALQQTYGLAVDTCGAQPERYVYLDDVLFSGGRIKSDLIRWIGTEAPPNAKVDILVLARHTQGSFFSERDIAQAAAAAEKNIALRFFARFLIEDRRARTNVSDVLRPTSIPEDPPTQGYAAGLGVPPVFRAPGSVGGHAFFSSEQGRNLLEQEFLKAGVRVKEMCPLLKTQHIPLGCTVQRMLGFGSTIITFRNCPNNAPLALWAGAPWLPLFPRVTN